MFQDAVDSINDGFYDMGPMRPNGKFYSLDELCQLPVNDKRPIIFVYAPEEWVFTNKNRKIQPRSNTFLYAFSIFFRVSRLQF